MAKANDLNLMANKLRAHSIRSTTNAGSGHPTSCMSCAEIMSVLFFDKLRKDDEFILSKGHAAPILWAAYAEAGLIPKKELMNLRKITSNLEGHPTPIMPLIKVATGSLGQGLSAGVGMALAKKMKNEKGRIYVLLGDGESAEGSVWEAANAASYHQLDNICAIVDVNRLGQSQETMHGHDMSAYKKKFEAFGWDTRVVDGHDVYALLSALSVANDEKKPFVILAKTFKGKGVSFLENKKGWHGKTLNDEQAGRAMVEIRAIKSSKVNMKSKITNSKNKSKIKNFKSDNYSAGDMVATRSAFGSALVNAGMTNKSVVVIDGDVKNSTMTQDFFKTFPKRGFESFIAEQNMVGMAIGMSAMGLTPFVATFGTFLTRAHDFIRMAMYSEANIKFIGSHVGVSIGEDGPSQMGLEDLPMFLSMPDSLVLYPCDAVSTGKLVREITFHKGISYLRTTREKTPIIYRNNESFLPGKFKVLRKSKQNKALVIGAGITVHEALKAHDALAKEGISIRVIDLYSIKPLDNKGLERHAKECKNNVIVVEDHYLGGIGGLVAEAVGKIHHLYIKDMPRSGTPEQLRKKYGIDAAEISKTVKKIIKKH
ncbi:transketolase [Candidatus Woesearchaeota archaeon]|nr:transketolase [Candidatus Woesearchaeota archaeon]